MMYLHIVIWSSVFSLTTFFAITVPCVLKALSFLGFVPQISLLPFGTDLIVPLFLWSIITLPPLQVYKKLMNSLECFGLPST